MVTPFRIDTHIYDRVLRAVISLRGLALVRVVVVEQNTNSATFMAQITNRPAVEITSFQRRLVAWRLR